MLVIYAIRHVGTGNAYIGSSRNEPNRRKSHLRALRTGRHHNAPLQAAWNRTGKKFSPETKAKMAAARKLAWKRSEYRAAVINAKNVTKSNT